jgi:hypothetical protein
MIRCNPKCTFRFRSLWILLAWWFVAVPRATATITATTSAPVHFAMEPREAFAHPQKHLDVENTNTSSPEDTSLTERQQCIRSRTGSVVIFGTAVLAAARVNRNQRARFPSEDDNDENEPNQDPLSRRHDLKWLFPQNAPPTDHPEQLVVMGTQARGAVADNSTPQLVSTTNKIMANAKAIASQKLQSNWMKRRNGSVPTNSSSKSTLPISTASPLNGKKAAYRQQQPKSSGEEVRLQAKYAAIESLEERAFTILVDLGMVETSSSTDSLENAWQ